MLRRTDGPVKISLRYCHKRRSFFIQNTIKVSRSRAEIVPDDNPSGILDDIVNIRMTAYTSGKYNSFGAGFYFIALDVFHLSYDFRKRLKQESPIHDHGRLDNVMEIAAADNFRSLGANGIELPHEHPDLIICFDGVREHCVCD